MIIWFGHLSYVYINLTYHCDRWRAWGSDSGWTNRGRYDCFSMWTEFQYAIFGWVSKYSPSKTPRNPEHSWWRDGEVNLSWEHLSSPRVMLSGSCNDDHDVKSDSHSRGCVHKRNRKFRNSDFSEITNAEYLSRLDYKVYSRYSGELYFHLRKRDQSLCCECTVNYLRDFFNNWNRKSRLWPLLNITNALEVQYNFRWASGKEDGWDTFKHADNYPPNLSIVIQLRKKTKISPWVCSVYLLNFPVPVTTYVDSITSRQFIAR